MAPLTNVRPEDIVEVDVRGRKALCFVDSKSPGTLHIRPITPNFTHRTVTARQVQKHWRLSRSRQSTGQDA
jgi:hypothetical protein